MDTAFSKMAETWPHLLLLLSLFNPLLSLNLNRQNKTDWVQPTTPSPTPLTEDRQDDTFPTVATGATDKLAEATTETKTIATTEEYEDSSLPTGQDNTHVTENQQATSRLSTARSIHTEAETTEVTNEAEITEDVTKNQQPTSSLAETTEVTTEAEITEDVTKNQQPTSSLAETTEVTTEAEITDEVTAQGSTFSSAMTTVPPVTTDTPELPSENTVTMETRTETTRHVVTTKTPETSATSTQHPGLSTSGSMSTTNATMGAVVPEVNPRERRPVTNHQPTTTIKPTTRGHQAPADKGGFTCSTPTSRRNGLVSQCLIAIAALAGVATIFIVSTIVLCTKLSSRKHKYRMTRAYSTEMVSISNLLPDGNGSHGRPRIPKSNGALIPNVEDSEGDDLTLHSFLPETDRGY